MSWSTETLVHILLDSSVRALAIAVCVALILASVRARSSGVRHASWTAVLLAMLLMPVLPNVVPSIRVPVRLQPPDVRWQDSGAQETPILLSSHEESAEPILAEPIVASGSHFNWLLVFPVVYGCGVLLLFMRLAGGWRAMRRVERMATPARPLRAAGIYESELVSTPMTIGLFSPRIILPVAWTTWSREKRRAILVHEIAHIRRRDPLIGFLSHLNCCLFWFHPLAWWLERKLAATAEQACDDAAVRALGDDGHARRYAQILVEIAEAVRRSGGRLSWQGVGVDGSLLNQRIERLLRGDRLKELSIARKLIVAAGCAATICVAAGGEQQRLPTLQEEQQALARVQLERQAQTARIAEQDATMQLWSSVAETARLVTPQQAEALEATIRANPQDLEARKKLLFFYAATSPAVPLRLQHILWLIENHPGDIVAGSWIVSMTDPAGYAAAKTRWLEQTAKPGVTTGVLSNAARFFEVADKPLAEEMILKAQALQPNSPWIQRLARVYALTILGATAVSPSINDYSGNLQIRSVSLELAHSAAANAVRRKLEATRNDVLLYEVAQYLVSRHESLGLDFSPGLSARSYYVRAVQLNPKSEAQFWLAMSKSGERQARFRRLLPTEGRYEAVMALPERDRFDLLWELALHTYSYGNSFGDRDDAKREWEKSRKYAAGLLELAPKFRSDPEYGVALFNANVMLGFVAAQNGDRTSALKYLREAAQAPGSKGPEYSTSAPWHALCNAAIDYGHKEVVFEFLEHLAQFDPGSTDEALAAAAELRNGGLPRWYRRSG